MSPLFSARAFRISKISSCLRMPVAPGTSSCLATFVRAPTLMSFSVARSIRSILSGVAAPLPLVPACGVDEVGNCSPGCRSVSTVRPVLRPSPPKPAARSLQIRIRVFAARESVHRAQAYRPLWPRFRRAPERSSATAKPPCRFRGPGAGYRPARARPHAPQPARNTRSSLHRTGGRPQNRRSRIQSLGGPPGGTAGRPPVESGKCWQAVFYLARCSCEPPAAVPGH